MNNFLHKLVDCTAHLPPPKVAATDRGPVCLPLAMTFFNPQYSLLKSVRVHKL